MRLYFYIVLIVVLTTGCECPPNLDTDKGFVPRESSYLSIISLLETPKPISVYSMNIKVKNLPNLQQVTHQDYFKFQSGIVDFKLYENNTPIFNTVIQTETKQYYSMLLYPNNKEIENLLIWENIDNTKKNLYLRFVNFSDIDKVRFIIKSNLPQNLEYNLMSKGITDLIAFPSIPFSIEVFKLPTDSLIFKLNNINYDLGNIVYLILSGDSKNFLIFQSINKYSTN